MDAVDFVVAPVTVGPVAVDLRVTVGAGSDVGRMVMAGMVRGDSAGSSAQNIPLEPVYFPPGPGPLPPDRQQPRPPWLKWCRCCSPGPCAHGALPLRPPGLGNRIDGLFRCGFWAAGRGSAGWDGLGSQGFSR